MIEELEKKGFRVGIRPQKMSGTWYWVAGVNVGDNERADWVDSKNGLPWACYNTYKEAMDAVIEYCNNYKPPKLYEAKSSKRSKRS